MRASPRPLRRALAGAVLALAGCGDPGGRDPRLLRVGHFPNVTHAHGLVGHATSRKGDGWFEKRLPPGTRLEWFVYNAGPSAMEGLLTGAIDLAYVGPNPALNAHLRTKGAEIRVDAGATRGGSALVVPASSTASAPADFRGLRVLTPQFGNTQDVACRAWFLGAGLRVTKTGGDVSVVPTPNPEHLALFRRGDVAGSWTVEPWVSVLEREGGRILVEEKDAITTVLVASTRAKRHKPDAVRAFVAAHRELTTWLTTHGDEARAMVGAELAAETRRTLSPAILARAWSRLSFRDAVDVSELQAFVASARAAGFLLPEGSLDRFVAAP
jgi:NitT/TauT family transport system substrate-binding protein